MAQNIKVPRIIGTVRVDGTIVPTDEFTIFMDGIVNGDTLSNTAVLGTITSGVASAQADAAYAVANAEAASSEADSANSNVTNATGGDLTLVAAPTSLKRVSSTSGALSTSSVTITASDGVAPYTYSWTKKSGGTQICNSPSSDTTNFSATLGENDTNLAIWTCTVTDSTGGTPLSSAIDVSVSFISSSSELLP